ncbi:hypothetical protein FOCC_FOCC015320 [Frankliniella occidentalis]|nr:hypothetical protein FOCC_FOCC015320 [Frankliniella occidentalis]
MMRAPALRTMMARLCLIVPFLFATVTSAGKADSWIDTFRKDHVRFYFFNKNTSQPDGYQISKDFQTEDILASGFKPEYPSKVIIPGWNSRVTNPLIQQLKNAYIDNNGGTDLNVIIVDWSDLSYFGFGNINGVGKRSAELLDFMGRVRMNAQSSYLLNRSTALMHFKLGDVRMNGQLCTTAAKSAILLLLWASTLATGLTVRTSSKLLGPVRSNDEAASVWPPELCNRGDH